MRVPIQQQASVAAANPYNSTSPLIQEADQSLARGLQSVSKGIDQVGGALGSAMEQQAREDKQAQQKALAEADAAKKRAQEVLIADGVVDLQRLAADEETKFLGTVGLQAAGASGPALDSLDKQLEEVGQRYTDPQQRSEFMVRGKAVLLAPRKSIETHTMREYAAGEKATLEARRTETIRAATSTDLSPEEMAVLVKGVDADYARILPPEVAAAASRELRGDMASAVIQRSLDGGDLHAAELQLKLDRDVLGEKRAGNFQKLLETKKAAAEKDAVTFSAQALVARTADAARNEYGFLDEGDENKLRDTVNEQYPERRKELSGIAESTINVEAERRQGQIKAWTQEAKTLRLKGGTKAIGAELRGKLEKYNPDYLEKIQEDDLKKWEHFQAKAAGGAAAKASDKKQKAANLLALTRMRGLSWQEQAAFEQQHGLEGLGLDEQGKADLQLQQRKAGNLLEKGFGTSKEKLDAEIEEATKGKVLKGEEPGAIFELKADAAEGLESFIEEKKRAPTPAERASIVSDATLRQKTKPRLLDSIRGPGQEFPFQQKKREGGMPTKLAPGRYESKSKPGTFFIVDAQGNKRPE